MQVLEMGSHDELLARGETGAYAALIQLQKAQEEEEENPKAPVSDHGIDVVKSDGQFVSRSSSHHSKHSLKAIRPSVTEDLQGRNSNGLKDSNALTSKTEQGLEDKPDLPSFRRLIALNKPEWKQGLLGLIGAIGFGFVQPTYAYIIADMLGAFYSDTPHELRQHIKIYVAIFMILAVAAFTVNILQHYNFAALGEYLTKRIRVNMLANILRNEVGWYDRDENSSGAICARLASDANMVNECSHLSPSMFFTNILVLNFLFVIHNHPLPQL
jgi:ATP-binding cassette subfamily B (MDR/TAP) protein 1